MKRLRNLCLLLLTALLLINGLPAASAASANGQGTERLSELAVSEAEFAALCSGRRETEEPLLQELWLDGMPLLWEEATGRWFYSLPEGSPERMDPALRYTGESGLALAVLGKITEETLRAGTPVRLLAYTGDRYSLYEIVCTTLPLLSVSAAAEIDAADVSVQLCLYDNRAAADTRLLTLRGKMHVRGQSTRRFPKKGYKLSLTDESGDKANASLLGLRDDDDWILYAGYNDQEKLRNVFSSQLWMDSCAKANSFRLTNGMEYRYVELFLDGRYHGLYALGYPIDAKQLHLGKTAFGETEEYLFKKVSWYRETKLKFNTEEKVPGYTLKGNTGGRQGTAWAALRSYYRVLLQESPSDPAALRSRLDMPNAIDIHLFFFLIQGSDNTDDGLKNVFLTRKQREDGYAMLYTPWDMDFSWGNQFTSGIATKTRMYALTPEDNFYWTDSPVQKLLDAGDETILEEIKTRYAQLRQGPWSDGSLSAMLDGFETDIFGSGAYGRDQARWPKGNYLEDSATGLDRFRQYVLDRLAYMDVYIADMQ